MTSWLSKNSRHSLEGIYELLIASKAVPLILLYELWNVENENIQAITQIYDMFERHFQRNEHTAGIKQKLIDKSYSRTDIAEMMKVLLPLKVDSCIIENLEELLTRV